MRNQPLHVLRIVCGNPHRVIDAESRVRPGTHGSHHILIGLVLLQQKIKHPFPLRCRTALHIHFGDPDKKSVPLEQALAGDRMDMAVPVYQIAKCLYRSYKTGFPLLIPARLAEPIPYRLMCQTTKLAKQAAVVAEKYAQPLWHGPYPLPVANRRKDLLHQPHPQQQRPLLITGLAAADGFQIKNLPWLKP